LLVSGISKNYFCSIKNESRRWVTRFFGKKRFSTILADPPRQFQKRTRKMVPEHQRLSHYSILSLQEIKYFPVEVTANETVHLYLWLPNALLASGIAVMECWDFTCKTHLLWYQVRRDDDPDRRGVGLYFRNVTEMTGFGVRGKNARILQAVRSQRSIISSRKPDEQCDLIESCRWSPRIQLFARDPGQGWHCWGNQVSEHKPGWNTDSNHSQAEKNTLPFSSRT